MPPEELAKAVSADVAAGLVPFFLCGVVLRLKRHPFILQSIPRHINDQFAVNKDIIGEILVHFTIGSIYGLHLVFSMKSYLCSSVCNLLDIKAMF